MVATSKPLTDSDGYDVAVIGAGMIGSAAGRYLAEAGHRVAIIGPAEPEDRRSSDGPFASHNDAGRITRFADVDSVWAELAAQSIARYDDMADRSGVTFHDPVGLALIKPAEQLEKALNNSTERGGDAKLVTPDWLRSNTGIAVPAGDGLGCAYEGPPAGLVNPRRLIQAELRLAKRAGATLITSAVTGLNRSHSSVTVSGPFGEIGASRVLLATGMYGGRLVGIELAVTRWPRVTVRLELDCKAELPSLIADVVSEPEIDQVYWVPPVEYPDGRVMLKIGGDYEQSEPVAEEDQIIEWFRSDGSASEAAALRGAVNELLPDARIHSWESVPCIVTKTDSSYPYLGWIDEQIAVAVGGNGGAAKSCDEIGRIAASLFLDQGSNDATTVSDTLDRSLFEPILKHRSGS